MAAGSQPGIREVALQFPCRHERCGAQWLSDQAKLQSWNSLYKVVALIVFCVCLPFGLGCLKFAGTPAPDLFPPGRSTTAAGFNPPASSLLTGSRITSFAATINHTAFSTLVSGDGCGFFCVSSASGGKSTIGWSRQDRANEAAPGGKFSLQVLPGSGILASVCRCSLTTPSFALQPGKLSAECVPLKNGNTKTGVCPPDVAPIAQVAPSLCLDTGAPSMSSRTPTAQSVLEYLRNVIERCRLEHRSDLERHYQETWQVAINAIYGPLPPRIYPVGWGAYPPLQNKPVAVETATPRWREIFKARPLKRIIGRDGDHEILECGHRNWHIPSLDPNKIPKRRRCQECGKAILAAQDAKNPAQATARGKKSKAVSA